MLTIGDLHLAEYRNNVDNTTWIMKQVLIVNWFTIRHQNEFEFAAVTPGVDSSTHQSPRPFSLRVQGLPFVADWLFAEELN